MNEKFGTAVDGVGLELGLQELEALEAPGFWTGFTAGAAVSGAAIASAAVSVALT